MPDNGPTTRASTQCRPLPPGSRQILLVGSFLVALFGPPFALQEKIASQEKNGQQRAETPSPDRQVKVLPWKQVWQVGLVISAPNGPVRGVVAQAALPMGWPEQQVEVGRTNRTDNVGRIRFRNLGGGARLIIVQVPQLQMGETARALLTLRIDKHVRLSPTH